MPKPIPYDELILPLAELIRRFLSGKYDYRQFQREFGPALHEYQRQIKGRAYSPLEVIADIPSHCKADLRKYCQEALERLPKEALDRATRDWVESTLIANEDGYTYFSFFARNGHSHFGSHAGFYSSPIERDSFLLSAFNGTLKPIAFRYVDLLAALRAIGGNEPATWVYGIEPDGALAIIHKVWSLGDAYAESYHLQLLERHPSPEGGGSYLMLLPKSKSWLLLHNYDYEQLTISLHGASSFITAVAARIGVQPEWGQNSSAE